MSGLFSSVRVRPPKMNRFNLSHDVKLTGKFGKLIPICCLDVLPGDVWKDSSEILVRFAPMLAPIMHRVNVYTHFFFVPKRLVWDNWKDFITGGEDGMSSPVYPRITLHNNFAQLLFKPGSLADYLGFPVIDSTKTIAQQKPFEIDALPFRAYQLIYNEYYRDQNLMDEIDICKDVDGLTALDGPDTVKVSNLMTIRNRCWQKDYFTSALPWAQRGDEVELPLQGTADLIYDEDSAAYSYGGALNQYYTEDGSVPSSDSPVLMSPAGLLKSGNNKNVNLTNGGTEIAVALKSNDLKELVKGVDLSTASSATINELRRAIKAQEFLEVAARGGSRYIEQIYSYFGVRSSDARLQRPQFLGGGKSPVVISDVLQTSQTTESSPQAQPAGHAVSVQRSHSFKFRSEEHGYIIGIMSIMPRPAYMQGMPRLFSKFDRLDYYWPQFAHLGEQEILNKEIYFDASVNQDESELNSTFGYTPRYAEYKFMTDSVHGDFRDSLLFWHMARKFSRTPGLNEQFLTDVETPSNRVFAVQDADFDKIWVNIHHNLTALRKMPKYGTPMF